MSYDFERIRSSTALIDAEAKCCTIREPKANELFIDVDSTEDRHWFDFNLSKARQHLGVIDHIETPSPSKELGHTHIVVTLERDVCPLERMLLQCVLGSDRQREALSWVRYVNNDPTPTLLFELKPLALAAPKEQP